MPYKKNPKIKYIFSDLDGTLALSRQQASDEILNIIGRIQHFVVVSGAAQEQILKQLPSIYVPLLSQNGNRCLSPEFFWSKKLPEVERQEALAYINKIIEKYNIYDNGDLIQDRGCQISFSLIGHNADQEKKNRFDEDGFIRHTILKENKHPASLVVTIGGTTNLDFCTKGCTKGANVLEYMNKKGWKKEECLYIGDKISKDGNDSSLKGICETIEVKSPLETLEILKLYAK